MLAVGSEAPDFELPNQTRRKVRLSDYRGKKHVVLAFHPLAFTPVCSAQMQAYEQASERFAALDAVVFGISLDAGPSKVAWAQSLGGISFELLSDFHPHGQVASAYGVMRADGISERAIFIVNKAGKIVWAKMHDIPEHPDVEMLLGELKKISP